MMTWLMRFGGGLAILPMVLAWASALVARARRIRPPQRPPARRAVTSLLLFSIGGGDRLPDPGIRRARAGALPRVDRRRDAGADGAGLRAAAAAGLSRAGGRIAAWQPWLYGGGQLLHIVGLVWSGGYGVQRKVAGAEQVLRTPPEVAGMGLMGLGGLIAIVGGIVFVVVAIRSMSSVASSGRRAR